MVAQRTCIFLIANELQIPTLKSRYNHVQLEMAIYTGAKITWTVRLPLRFGSRIGLNLGPDFVLEYSILQWYCINYIILVYGDKRVPTLRVYFRNFIRIFWYF